VPFADEKARREAKLERLILAKSDMADTAAAARLLREARVGNLDLPWRALRALETGMFVSYARAFNESRGDPPKPAAPTSGLSLSERETHKWACDERDMVWAHVDRYGHRKVTEAQKGPPTIYIEEWVPPSPEQLEAFAALAEKLEERYRVEAEALWHELQS
jgi:hypothetical protein